MMDTMLKERSMVKENLHGQTRVPLQGISLIITSMVQEYMSGQMVVFSLGIGATIKWKVMERLHGPMAENMWVNMWTI